MYKRTQPGEGFDSTREADWSRAELSGVSLTVRSLVAILLFVFLALSVLSPLKADETQPDALRLIELYTSHGCSSCPKADRLLAELLAEDDQLLALEFHVDYWNNLVHGSAGSFQDPFSTPSHSMRQREYNAGRMKGRPGVYTPQAIVNGRFATVGSNRRHITKALAQPAEQLLDIAISQSANQDSLTLVVSGSDEQRVSLAGTDITVAHYIDQASTRITGGENQNKTLINHHIVTRLTRLGEVSATTEMSFDISRPAVDEGCVILIQEQASTPIFAAARCP